MLRVVLSRLAPMVLLLGLMGNLQAADGGKSVYLLGKRGPLAAFVPKPGIYITNDVYFYDASSSDFLPVSDLLAQDMTAQALIDIPQFTWVTDISVAGGRLAFSALLPFGTIDVDARGSVQLPDGTEISRGRSDSDSGFGDPIIGASLGWKHRDGDRFRAWSGYSSVWIPVGSYDQDSIANLGSNRWALDLGGAYTMANFKGGRELSAVLGVTFNGKNQDKDYESGTELHLELAGKQHLPKGWSGGLVGYYYRQLSADSGSAAVLGDFKGEVVGIGPEISWQLKTKMPLTLDLRWYHEFSAENRLEGDGFFLTASMPLRIRPARDPATDWTPDTREQGE